MPDDFFVKIIEDTLETLPLEFKEKLHNISVVTADWPNMEQLRKVGVTRGLLLGLYEGVPKAKGGYYRTKLPDKITLFKYPLMRVSRSIDDFQKRVRHTVIHEIAHHFGMDEEAVRSAERVRDKLTHITH